MERMLKDVISGHAPKAGALPAALRPGAKKRDDLLECHKLLTKYVTKTLLAFTELICYYTSTTQSIRIYKTSMEEIICLG